MPYPIYMYVFIMSDLIFDDLPTLLKPLILRLGRSYRRYIWLVIQEGEVRPSRLCTMHGAPCTMSYLREWLRWQRKNNSPVL